MKDTKDESIARTFLKLMLPDKRKDIIKMSGKECLELFRGDKETKDDTTRM